MYVPEVRLQQSVSTHELNSVCQEHYTLPNNEIMCYNEMGRHFASLKIQFSWILQ